MLKVAIKLKVDIKELLTRLYTISHDLIALFLSSNQNKTLLRAPSKYFIRRSHHYIVI